MQPDTAHPDQQQTSGASEGHESWCKKSVCVAGDLPDDAHAIESCHQLCTCERRKGERRVSGRHFGGILKGPIPVRRAGSDRRALSLPTPEAAGPGGLAGEVEGPVGAHGWVVVERCRDKLPRVVSEAHDRAGGFWCHREVAERQRVHYAQRFPGNLYTVEPVGARQPEPLGACPFPTPVSVERGPRWSRVVTATGATLLPRLPGAIAHWLASAINAAARRGEGER